jgi:hypothetical protein
MFCPTPALIYFSHSFLDTQRVSPEKSEKKNLMVFVAG